MKSLINSARRTVHAYPRSGVRWGTDVGFPVFEAFDRLRAMAALKPVAGVIKFRFIHHIGSDVDVGTHLYLHTTQVPTQAQMASVVDAAHTAYGTSCAALLHNLGSLEEVNCMDLSDPAGAFAANATPIAGTRAGSPPPANATALMTFPVARRYRGGKPRLYWPFGAQADIATPQTWTTAFTGACHTGVNGLYSAIVNNVNSWAPGAVMCNVSYYEGGEWKQDHLGNYHRIPTPRATPKVDDASGDFAFQVTFGSQRRRLHPN